MSDLVYPYTDIKVKVNDLVVILNMPDAKDLYITGIYVVKDVNKRHIVVKSVRSGQQFDMERERVNTLRLVRPEVTDIPELQPKEEDDEPSFDERLDKVIRLSQMDYIQSLNLKRFTKSDLRRVAKRK